MNDKLDQMFENTYGPYASAKSAIELQDALDRLLVAVWEYQDKHDTPYCDHLDEALTYASIANNSFDGGTSEVVQREFHRRGLDLIKYREMSRDEHFRRQDEKARQQKKNTKAKPKTQKKANAA